MLTSPSFREALQHVAIRVLGIKSRIVHCFASQTCRSTAWGNLAAVRDYPSVAEFLTTTPRLNSHNR